MKAAVLLLPIALWSEALAAPEARTCGPLRPGWYGPGPEPQPTHALVLNRISLSGSDDLRWNGRLITLPTLSEYLRSVRALRPLPFTALVLAPSAGCTLVEAVRDEMTRRLPCADGACGETFAGRNFSLEPSPRTDLTQDQRDSIEADRQRARAEVENAADALEAEAEARHPNPYDR